MYGSENSHIISESEMTEQQKKALHRAYEMGYYGEFAQGERLKIWKAGYTSDLSVNEEISGFNSNILFVTKEGQKDPTWVSSSDGIPSPSMKDSACIAYPIKRLLTLRRGFELVLDKDFNESANFMDGKAHESHKPQQAHVNKVPSRPSVLLTEAPQFVIPRRVMTDCGLWSELLRFLSCKNGEARYDENGTLVADLLPVDSWMSIADVILELNKRIEASSLVSDGHHYLLAEVKMTNEAYFSIYQGKIDKASRIGYLEIVGE